MNNIRSVIRVWFLFHGCMGIIGNQDFWLDRDYLTRTSHLSANCSLTISANFVGVRRLAGISISRLDRFWPSAKIVPFLHSFSMLFLCILSTKKSYTTSTGYCLASIAHKEFFFCLMNAKLSKRSKVYESCFIREEI